LAQHHNVETLDSSIDWYSWREGMFARKCLNEYDDYYGTACQ